MTCKGLDEVAALTYYLFGEKEKHVRERERERDASLSTAKGRMDSDAASHKVRLHFYSATLVLVPKCTEPDMAITESCYGARKQRC